MMLQESPQTMISGGDTSFIRISKSKAVKVQSVPWPVDQWLHLLQESGVVATWTCEVQVAQKWSQFVILLRGNSIST